MNTKYKKFRDILKNRAIEGDKPCLKYIKDDKIVTVTNREFVDECRIYCHIIKKLSISSIAIILPKTPELIYYFMGSILAGVRTCLIETTEPIQKIEQMLQTFQPEYIAKDSRDFSDEENAVIEKTLSSKNKGELIGDGNAVFFTSGTSGPAKGVLLAASSLLTSSYNGQEMLPCNEGDVVLSLIPFSHIYGFICTFLWPLCYGGVICLGRGMRSLLVDPKAFNPTILPIIPSLATFLLFNDALNTDLKTILIGAGPLSKATIQLILKKKINLSFGYGLTETSSGVAIYVKGDDPLAMTKCPGNSFKIADDGRILIKSDSLMLGYYNDEKATDKVVKNGYFITNDLGYLDKDGLLHVSGRTDDILVLANGTKFNCGPAEEKLQAQLPYLDFAFAEDKGKIKLVYHSKDIPKENIESCVNAFNAEQPMYSKISLVERLDSPLPRTKTKKIQRYKL